MFVTLTALPEHQRLLDRRTAWRIRRTCRRIDRLVRRNGLDGAIARLAEQSGTPRATDSEAVFEAKRISAEVRSCAAPITVGTRALAVWHLARLAGVRAELVAAPGGAMRVMVANVELAVGLHGQRRQAPASFQA